MTGVSIRKKKKLAKILSDQKLKNFSKLFFILILWSCRNKQQLLLNSYCFLPLPTFIIVYEIWNKVKYKFRLNKKFEYLSKYCLELINYSQETISFFKIDLCRYFSSSSIGKILPMVFGQYCSLTSKIHFLYFNVTGVIALWLGRKSIAMYFRKSHKVDS